MGSYPQAVDYLYRLQWHGNKLGLENIRQLLNDLNNPHTQYRAVHIAGTNGKGSTAALIASVLQAQGYRTGLYTSPHLVDFSERIRVNGTPIAQEDVARLTEKIIQLTTGQTQGSAPARNSRLTPTFFEFTTAMAFTFFAESDVDIAVVEVGMGGCLDATNVITPLVSVITNIHYDHQNYLGDTLSQIASEKAGIVKQNVPTVTAVTETEAYLVIAKVCGERQSRLYHSGKEFCVEGSSPEDFLYRGMTQSWLHLSMGLRGQHQLQNAACALATTELLSGCGLTITETSIRDGFRSVQWEGRLEPIENPRGPLIYLDGAHNPAGAEALKNFLLGLKTKRGGKLFIVLGILQDKDIGAVLKQLVPLADELILTRPDYHRAASMADLESAARPLGVSVNLRERVGEAVELAKAMAGPEDCICITGSLFTVGEARAALKHLGTPSPLKG
jgi:dihydrofolate synthase / folylpolyglutamate synthase